MDERSHWEQVKEFYRNRLGIREELVELNADYTILLLCASGASTKTICSYLDLEEKDVWKIVEDAFGFPGWFKDLSFNPYKIFNDAGGNKERFFEMLPTPNMYKFLLGICESMKAIEEKLNNEWI